LRPKGTNAGKGKYKELHRCSPSHADKEDYYHLREPVSRDCIYHYRNACSNSVNVMAASFAWVMNAQTWLRAPILEARLEPKGVICTAQGRIRFPTPVIGA